MKNFLLLAALIFCNITLFAQDDDMPDYRSKVDNFTRIPDKELRADLAAFTFGGINESLTKRTLQQLPLLSVNKDEIVFADELDTVRITSGIFDASKHKVTTYGDDKFVTKIDNRAFYGKRGETPTSSIASVKISLGLDTLSVPNSALFDLYQPALSYSEGGKSKTHCAVYKSADGHNYYIYMLNGTGKGMYEVTWVIKDKHYLRRVIDWTF